MRQINFGTHMEMPSNLQLIITWDSINNHHDFMKSSTYGPFLQRFTSMVDGEPSMMHVELKPEAAFPKVLSAPATEIGIHSSARVVEDVVLIRSSHVLL